MSEFLDDWNPEGWTPCTDLVVAHRGAHLVSAIRVLAEWHARNKPPPGAVRQVSGFVPHPEGMRETPYRVMAPEPPWDPQGHRVALVWGEHWLYPPGIRTKGEVFALWSALPDSKEPTTSEIWGDLGTWGPVEVPYALADFMAENCLIGTMPWEIDERPGPVWSPIELSVNEGVEKTLIRPLRSDPGNPPSHYASTMIVVGRGVGGGEKAYDARRGAMIVESVDLGLILAELRRIAGRREIIRLNDGRIEVDLSSGDTIRDP